MGSLRSHSHATSRGDESLARCRQCASMLVQPQGWKELREGAVCVRLRCPECYASTTGNVRPDVLARYDKELVRGHNAVLALYEALVYHNMSELADRFARALELDLIGADDFGLGLGARQPA